MGNETVNDGDRRNFLIKLSSVVGGAGVAATCVPFVASMNPSSDVLAKAETEVDLTDITPGAMRSNVLPFDRHMQRSSAWQPACHLSL